MLRTRELTVVVMVSMIAGAILHAVISQPSVKAQAGQPFPHPQEQDKSPHGVTVVCQVEGGGRILSIVPEGTHVKRGDLLCELDASSLKDRLTERDVAVKLCEIELQQARLAHESCASGCQRVSGRNVPAK